MLQQRATLQNIGAIYCCHGELTVMISSSSKSEKYSQFLDHGLQLFPNQPHCLCQLAYTMLASGKLVQARQLLQTALQLNPAYEYGQSMLKQVETAMAREL